MRVSFLALIVGIVFCGASSRMLVDRTPPDSGVAMTRKMAELLHLEVGDHVIIKPAKGLRTLRSVPVVEISDSYIGLSVYAEINFLSRLIDEEQALTGVQLAMDPRREAYKIFYREVKRVPCRQPPRCVACPSLPPMQRCSGREGEDSGSPMPPRGRSGPPRARRRSRPPAPPRRGSRRRGFPPG